MEALLIVLLIGLNAVFPKVAAWFQAELKVNVIPAA